MEKRRSKLEWDQISTVYEFHRDRKNLALYSHLHEWVLNQNKKSVRSAEDKQPLIGDEGIAEGDNDRRNVTVNA